MNLTLAAKVQRETRNVGSPIHVNEEGSIGGIEAHQTMQMIWRVVRENEISDSHGIPS